MLYRYTRYHSCKSPSSFTFEAFSILRSRLVSNTNNYKLYCNPLSISCIDKWMPSHNSQNINTSTVVYRLSMTRLILSSLCWLSSSKFSKNDWPLMGNSTDDQLERHHQLPKDFHFRPQTISVDFRFRCSLVSEDQQYLSAFELFPRLKQLLCDSVSNYL